MKYPKVGEKFYYLNSNNELVERTCVHIEKQEGFERQYFSTWDEYGGTFVNESSILDQDGEEFKELKAEKEREEWKQFWTKERIDEFMTIPSNISILDYIKSKIE